MEQDELDGAAETDVEAGETMESLLAGQQEVQRKLSQRQVIWVKVVSVTVDSVLVDIGEKQDAALALSEFTDESAPGEVPRAGSRVPVILTGRQRGGAPMLSHKQARTELAWQAALKAYREKQRVHGKIISVVKGGFVVAVGGGSGFLPLSLADARRVQAPARMVGMGVRCHIIEIDEAKKRFVLSRKAVLDEDAAKRRVQTLAELKIGAISIGRVLRQSAEGLFVEVGGLEGFVRPEDIAWGSASDVRYERGAKLRLKLMSKPGPEDAPDARTVRFGIKQLKANPADSVRRQFPPKTVVKGKVTEVSDKGVKMSIDEKNIAFCPPSETDPDEIPKVGDQVSGVAYSVDDGSFAVLVSLKRFIEMRDRKKMAQYLKAPPPLRLGQLFGADEKLR